MLTGHPISGYCYVIPKLCIHNKIHLCAVFWVTYFMFSILNPKPGTFSYSRVIVESDVGCDWLTKNADNAATRIDRYCRKGRDSTFSYGKFVWKYCPVACGTSCPSPLDLTPSTEIPTLEPSAPPSYEPTKSPTFEPTSPPPSNDKKRRDFFIKAKIKTKQ